MKDKIITNACKMIRYFNERLTENHINEAYKVAYANVDSKLFKSFYDATRVMPSEEILGKLEHSGIEKFEKLASNLRRKNLASKF